MLSDVLAVFAVEQNAAYPPHIYQAHYRTVTSFLLSKLCEIYPSSPEAVDMIDPFVKQQLIAIKNGYIDLPEDYRNILGAPMIASKNDGSGECSDVPVTESDFKNKINQSKCRQTAITIVPQSEFALKTESTYNFPTYDNPIGYNSGKKQIKICPYDLTKVLLTYAKNETPVVYGYIMQPDDTYIFNFDTSVESEWTNAAYAPLFKGICALYAAYTRDGELVQWSEVLKQTGLI